MFPAVTVSLVPELKGGPFLFWDGVAHAASVAKELGFPALEIFPPHADGLDVPLISTILAAHQLKVAAIGTGAGWGLQKLSLSHPGTQAAAIAFVQTIMDKAALLGAPVIIGSMQGRWGDGITRDQGFANLTQSLQTLADYAAKKGIRLLYEPLNRYESNFCNTLASGQELLHAIGRANVFLLADLFHMNIEESNLAEAIRQAGSAIGHVHIADSNRRPAGSGHTDFAPVFTALKDIGYNQAISAEAFPFPDSDAAATATIQTFRKYA